MTAPSLIRSIPLFDGISDDDLDALFASLARRSFAPGQLIFGQGEIGDALFIIESGDVNIFLPGEASRRVSLADLAAGEIFGELAIFDEQPRSASALATTSTSLFELKHAQLEAFISTRPRAAMALLGTISRRLRETNALLSGRAARNVSGLPAAVSHTGSSPPKCSSRMPMNRS